MIEWKFSCWATLEFLFFRTCECWASWGSKSGFLRELWGGVRSPTQPLTHYSLSLHQHPKPSLTSTPTPSSKSGRPPRSPVQPSPGSRVQEEASLASGPLSKDPLRGSPDFQDSTNCSREKSFHHIIERSQPGNRTFPFSLFCSVEIQSEH